MSSVKFLVNEHFQPFVIIFIFIVFVNFYHFLKPKVTKQTVHQPGLSKVYQQIFRPSYHLAKPKFETFSEAGVPQAGELLLAEAPLLEPQQQLEFRELAQYPSQKFDFQFRPGSYQTQFHFRHFGPQPLSHHFRHHLLFISSRLKYNFHIEVRNP